MQIFASSLPNIDIYVEGKFSKLRRRPQLHISSEIYDRSTESALELSICVVFNNPTPDGKQKRRLIMYTKTAFKIYVLAPIFVVSHKSKRIVRPTKDNQVYQHM